MSWTETFPILTDENIGQYDANATRTERATLEDLLGVAQVINRQSKPHIVATSLFWKPLDICNPQLPTPTEELIRNAQQLGLVQRYAPWSYYVEPILNGARQLAQSHPEVTVRVYLASDLEFLVPHLKHHCEVHLMRSSSICHSPGAMWRFLALEDFAETCTIMDADELATTTPAALRATMDLKARDLGFWRKPMMRDIDLNEFVVYKPIIATRLGTSQACSAGKLLRAFVWHIWQGTWSNYVTHPVYGRKELFGFRWPNYCLDEAFLYTAIYVRLAPTGCLTIVGLPVSSWYWGWDMEYVTAANPNSQLVYLAPGGAEL